MRPLRTLVLGFALLALMAACADSTSPEGTESAAQQLSGSSWVLSEVAIDGNLQRAVDDRGSLNFNTDGSLSGSTGCNRFTGTWTSEGTDLTLQTGPMTLMGCPENLQKQETAVMAALSATNGYTISSEALALADADGNTLALYRAAATNLAGTSWRATGVNNGKGGVESTASTSDITLVFGSDAMVSGFGGCTQFTGAYTIDGASLVMTGVAATTPCAATSQEAAQQQYLAALSAVTRFGIDGTRLELRDDEGALQVSYTAAG